MTDDEKQKIIDARLAGETGVISFEPLIVRLRRLSHLLSREVKSVVVVLFINGSFVGYALPSIEEVK